MTLENLKKQYAHYKNLMENGVKTENSTRNALIKSDAEKYLKDLVKKNPNIEFEPKEEVKEEPKSKGKNNGRERSR